MSVLTILQDGVLVAVKRREGDPTGDRLGEEADLLDRARHPNVVATLATGRTGARHPAVTDDDGAPALHLVHTGERTWDSTPPATAHDLAAGLASVASTVADLHDLGIVHGALDDPGHVIVASDGRAVLCGFGRATHHDGPADAGCALARQADVVALGRLLGHLVGRLGESPGPTDRRRRAALDRLATDLAGLGAAADLAGPSRLVTARDVARQASVIAGPVRTPTTRATGRSGSTGRRRHRVASDPAPAMPRWRQVPVPSFGAVRVGVAAAAVATLVAALWVLVALGGDTTTAMAPDPPGAATTSTSPPDPRSSTTVDIPAPPTTLAPTSPSAPPPAPTTPAAGPATEVPPPTTTTVTGSAPAGTLTVVDHDGRPYEIEVEGAAVAAVADWDCDGTATPALLQLDTGAVWVFASWSTDGPVTAQLVETVPGATGLAPATATCPALVALTPAGEHLVSPVGTPATPTGAPT